MALFGKPITSIVLCVATLFAAGCATVDPSPTHAAPFSGEIVYEVRVFDTSGPEKLVGTYELHYFVSGNRWKHTLGDGRLVAQYDPATKQIHNFIPERRTYSATQGDDSYQISHTTETRQILGYECKGVKRVSATETLLEFYTPEVRIDPTPFLDHHYKGWAEFLKFTNGAIGLDSEITQPGNRISMKAIRIERKTFDDAFWDTGDK